MAKTHDRFGKPYTEKQIAAHKAWKACVDAGRKAKTGFTDREKANHLAWGKRINDAKKAKALAEAQTKAELESETPDYRYTLKAYAPKQSV